jgi:predicted GIY-YIG superfamily endonuclease
MENYVYVYRLVSSLYPNKVYVGLTENLSARLIKHNEGGVPSTAPYKPWIIETAHAFRSREKAVAFERYLKTGSGREFTRRHL